jgi:membrane protein YdbS with pleckstrin-like domain
MLLQSNKTKGVFHVVYVNSTGLLVAWVWTAAIGAFSVLPNNSSSEAFKTFSVAIIIFIWYYYPVVVTCAYFKHRYHVNKREKMEND